MKERCGAIVWCRDTYRYTGRGRTGFEMHYTRRRCRRTALRRGRCYQHQAFDAVDPHADSTGKPSTRD